MSENQDILFATKPSLRRVFFFAFLYAVAVLSGRVATELDPRFNPFWWATLGLLLTLLAYAYLVKLTTTYIITPEEIQKHSGILARRITVVPLIRVTNAVANQSFLERLLGLVNLQIDSAGGDSKEMVFTRILKSDGLDAAAIIRQKRVTNIANPATQQMAVASGG